MNINMNINGCMHNVYVVQAKRISIYVLAIIYSEPNLSKNGKYISHFWTDLVFKIKYYQVDIIVVNVINI